MKSLTEFQKENSALSRDVLKNVFGGGNVPIRDTTYYKPTTGESGCDYITGGTLDVGTDWHYQSCGLSQL